VGGMEISFGKLALYTAGGGINPKRTIAVSLDVGTDNEQLLQDPFYVGNRHARRRGADYDAFIQQYVETANRLFPQAMLPFEDFGAANARRSWTSTRRIIACSTTTCRAPARLSWPRSTQRCGSAVSP
jgi:malate dehydrogenase (oxaloacetate-decarboxylating)